MSGDAHAELVEGRRLAATRRFPPVLVWVVLVWVALLAGCGGGSSGGDGTTTSAAPDAPSVLESPEQGVTFAQVRAAIDDLYRTHPDVDGFIVKDVEYNPVTRDKVLDVCRRGGAESDAASQESVRIAGCAPLIFFFYEYGRQSSVPESIDLARKLYWYAVSNIRGPFDPRDSLSGLLRSWGIP